MLTVKNCTPRKEPAGTQEVLEMLFNTAGLNEGYEWTLNVGPQIKGSATMPKTAVIGLADNNRRIELRTKPGDNESARLCTFYVPRDCAHRPKTILKRLVRAQDHLNQNGAGNLRGAINSPKYTLPLLDFFELRGRQKKERVSQLIKDTMPCFKGFNLKTIGGFVRSAIKNGLLQKTDYRGVEYISIASGGKAYIQTQRRVEEKQEQTTESNGQPPAPIPPQNQLEIVREKLRNQYPDLMAILDRKTELEQQREEANKYLEQVDEELLHIEVDLEGEEAKAVVTVLDKAIQAQEALEESQKALAEI